MILVVGDSMLDRYWEGKVDRISPEAPVPVLSVSRETSRPGGAANVAANIASLGAEVRLVSPMADDQSGRELRLLLRQAGVTVTPVDCLRTTQKIRFVASRQQLLRADFDDNTIEGSVQRLASRLGPDVLVLSDYAKGALKDAAQIILEADCTTLVDPKGDFAKYRGATLLKPNEAETWQAVGGWTDELDFLAKCAALRESLGLPYLLVTRGEKGMALFGEGECLELKSEVREVYDVSGAGDTVLAALAVFVSRGMEIRDACVLANKAAGVVVGKFGTATVSMAELQ